jgi:hypothetical protein
MPPFGVPELITIALGVIGMGVPIWLAIKTRPLGRYPYRWGLYIGIETGLVGITMALFTLSALPRVSFYAFYAPVLALCAAVAAAGLIRRRRFGVVLFFITYVLLLVSDPTRALPWLLFIVPNIFYFRKRWGLMTPEKALGTLVA